MNHKLTILIASAALALPVLSLRAEDAKVIWAKKCALCHGVDGAGKVNMKTKNYTDAKVQADVKDDAILKTIKEGVAGSKMKGFAGKLTDDEIKALAAQIRSFKK